MIMLAEKSQELSANWKSRKANCLNPGPSLKAREPGKLMM